MYLDHDHVLQLQTYCEREDTNILDRCYLRLIVLGYHFVHCHCYEQLRSVMYIIEVVAWLVVCGQYVASHQVISVRIRSLSAPSVAALRSQAAHHVPFERPLMSYPCFV